jgi:large subunit ribosomal protein L34
VDRVSEEILQQDLAMHYPHRVSRVKRKRAIGFRARMKTKNGRKLINRKRAAGRSLNVADKRGW